MPGASESTGPELPRMYPTLCRRPSDATGIQLVRIAGESHVDPPVRCYVSMPSLRMSCSSAAPPSICGIMPQPKIQASISSIFGSWIRNSEYRDIILYHKDLRACGLISFSRSCSCFRGYNTAAAVSRFYNIHPTSRHSLLGDATLLHFILPLSHPYCLGTKGQGTFVLLFFDFEPTPARAAN